MNVLAVTISHDTKRRLANPFGKVTKAELRDEFRGNLNEVNAEFVTIGGVMAPSGKYLTAREALAQGIDMIEVRSDDHVDLIAAIYLKDNQAVVR